MILRACSFEIFTDWYPSLVVPAQKGRSCSVTIVRSTIMLLTAKGLLSLGETGCSMAILSEGRSKHVVAKTRRHPVEK